MKHPVNVFTKPSFPFKWNLLKDCLCVLVPVFSVVSFRYVEFSIQSPYGVASQNKSPLNSLNGPLKSQQFLTDRAEHSITDYDPSDHREEPSLAGCWIIGGAYFMQVLILVVDNRKRQNS